MKNRGEVKIEVIKLTEKLQDSNGQGISTVLVSLMLQLQMHSIPNLRSAGVGKKSS